MNLAYTVDKFVETWPEKKLAEVTRCDSGPPILPGPDGHLGGSKCLARNLCTVDEFGASGVL